MHAPIFRLRLSSLFLSFPSRTSKQTDTNIQRRERPSNIRPYVVPLMMNACTPLHSGYVFRFLFIHFFYTLPSRQTQVLSDRDTLKQHLTSFRLCDDMHKQLHLYSFSVSPPVTLLRTCSRRRTRISNDDDTTRSIRPLHSASIVYIHTHTQVHLRLRFPFVFHSCSVTRVQTCRRE